MTYKLMDDVFDHFGVPQFMSHCRKLMKKVMADWNGVGTNLTLKYCPCLTTVYYFDKKRLKTCPTRSLPKTQAFNLKYESVRSFLIAIYTNKELMKRIKEVRKPNNESMSSIFDGNLFKESLQKANEDDYNFTFHLSFSGDGVNLHQKTYHGVFPTTLCILDLPPKLRSHAECTFIPLVTETKKQTAGHTEEMMRILFKDLEQLSTEGFQIEIDGHIHTIKANLICITGDLPALGSFTETLNSGATFPCQFCKTPNTSFPGRSKAILFPEPGVEFITTPYMRQIYERKQFSSTANTWRVKGRFLSYNISQLDFMRSSVPDLMHVLCENVFTKRIMAVFESLQFKQLDKPFNLNLLEEFDRINESLINAMMFEDVDSVEACAKISTSYFKAIDFKLFCHAFPLYFRHVIQRYQNSVPVRISMLSLELNAYLLVLLSKEIPNDVVSDGITNHLWFSFKILMEEIKTFAIAHPFLEIIFSLPTHMLMHMFLKLADFGSFTDIWRFVMQRPCKTVRSTVKPNRQSIISLNKKITCISLLRCFKMMNYIYSNVSCYESIKRPPKVKDISKLGTKIIEFRRRIRATNTNDLFVSELPEIVCRGTKVILDSVRSYGRIKLDGTWHYVEVLRLLKFEKDGHVGYSMQYKILKTETEWLNCSSGLFKFSLFTKVTGTENESKWIWLDNTVDFHGVAVLKNNDNVILDKRPLFSDILKRDGSSSVTSLFPLV